MMEIFLVILLTIIGGIAIEIARRMLQEITRAKLSVDFETSYVTLNPGKRYTMRWRVRNLGRSELENVLFVLELPPGFAVRPEQNVVEVGDLHAGEMMQLELNIYAPEAIGVYKSAVLVAGSDPNMKRIEAKSELLFNVVERAD